MPNATLPSTPTAHTDAELTAEGAADITAELGRDPAAHTDGDIVVYGPGDR